MSHCFAEMCIHWHPLTTFAQLIASYGLIDIPPPVTRGLIGPLKLPGACMQIHSTCKLHLTSCDENKHYAHHIS